MKKLVSLVLALMMMLSALPMAIAEEYREPITLTVFSQLANYAGEQPGWFGKEIKDRFNVTLKLISSNGDTNAFTSGILPLITPILATLCIFSAVGQWNSFTDTMMLMPSGKNYTLQFLLYKYQREAQSLAALVRNTQDTNALANSATKQTSLSVQMTVAMVVTFPILLVYPFFQRFFVKGIMIGAVKG